LCSLGSLDSIASRAGFAYVLLRPESSSSAIGYELNEADADGPTILRLASQPGSRPGGDQARIAPSTLDLAQANGSIGVMLIMQANPFDGDPSQLSGFVDTLDLLETETIAFGKPVMLVHGDSHYFRIDKPLLGTNSGRRLENFTRLETFGTDDVH
jgi:hypothetical protein